jgi:hypothetical protein
MSRLEAEIKDRIFEFGYAFLQAYNVQSEATVVAAAIGQLLIPWNGGLVQKLVPRREASPNTYSGIYGLGYFPLHTDLAHWNLPPRYLMLRCIRGYEDVPTLLLDGKAFIDDRSLLDILTRAIFKPRRPIAGEIKLLRLCEAVETGYRIRWDEVFLRPASQIGTIADQRIRAHLASSNPISISLTNPGDTLIIDNWRMLHARSPISNHQHDRDIERVYLETLN